MMRGGDAAGGQSMKNSSRFVGLVLTLLGVMVLLNNLGKPRVEALHGSDVWGLVASGICLGIGFVGLIGRLKLGSLGTSNQRGDDIGLSSLKRSPRNPQ
jgi:hypothetical protein